MRRRIYLVREWRILAMVFCLLGSSFSGLQAQNEHSLAREWNELLLTAIRNDLARPTVHARNLFHVSAAMYDAWAMFDDEATPYLLGNTVNGFTGCPLESFVSNEGVERSREVAISFAAYKVLLHRFGSSPGAAVSVPPMRSFMSELGLNPDTRLDDLASGSPVALGNYIANCYIAYGQQDGSNEQNDYANQYYQPVNENLFPRSAGNPNISDLNRYQLLTLARFVDQGGNVFTDSPEFLSAEWGNVFPFSMTNEDRVKYSRDGDDYYVYNDPGLPPLINDSREGMSDEYKWGFNLVSIWGAHLDPSDGVMWDISPGSIGNAPELPTDFRDYRNFYKLEGGDISEGHEINPITGQPYPENVVPRGDYSRVLAEFWADGPDSETPPGHWFTILNFVNDHPMSDTRFKGEGEPLPQLEWDIKAYFTLGGAMHDAAVSAWSIKGWYDYIRPISAIRGMGDLGQSSDPNLPNYNPQGLLLEPGFIEQVQPGDPLASQAADNIDRVKVLSWRGPDFIGNPANTVAGVGWIMANSWWPYQRPTFVTPPFAGYVSGHSTYSRAAAEVLERLTGDPFFPGGVGEFVAPRNEFLVFEDGPSVDVVLQWATYRDASDQTSLSRIWGGIHPPADDIPGRIIGAKIGNQAFNYAENFFSGDVPSTFGVNDSGITIGPNPVARGSEMRITIFRDIVDYEFKVLQANGSEVTSVNITQEDNSLALDTSGLPSGVYLLHIRTSAWAETIRFLVNE